MCISNGNNSGNGIGSLAVRYSKISTDAGKARRASYRFL